MVHIVVVIIVSAIIIYKLKSNPAKEVRAIVTRKGEPVNTERKAWFRPTGNGGVNLNWIVVFQDVNTGEEIELEVPGFKYDELKQGQEGLLRYRFGYFKQFEVD